MAAELRLAISPAWFVTVPARTSTVPPDSVPLSLRSVPAAPRVRRPPASIAARRVSRSPALAMETSRPAAMRAFATSTDAAAIRTSAPAAATPPSDTAPDAFRRKLPGLDTAPAASTPAAKRPAAVDRRGVDRDVVPACDDAGIRHGACAGERDGAQCSHRAGILDARRRRDRGIGRSGEPARVHQSSVGGERQRAGLRLHRAAHVHAQSRFGADHADAVGVHAADRGDVECERGSGALACDRRCAERRVVDAVRTRHEREFARPEVGVDGDGAGEHVDAVDVARIQSRAFETHHAAADVERVERPGRAEYGHARREHAARRIDEAAARAGDAVRVGDHQFGAAAGDFGESAQRTWPRRPSPH